MTQTDPCPIRFVVVPDDPLNPYNIWVSTNCAYSCRDPTLTPQEHKTIDSLVGYNSRIGAFLTLCLLSYLIKTNRSKRRYVFMSMTISSFLLSISMSILINNPNKLCFNNAVGYRDVNGWSLCIVQGALIEYSALATSYSIAMQSIELYSMVVLNKTWHNYWLYQVGFIFLFPFVSVAITACVGTFGLAGKSPYCLTPDDAKQAPIDLLTIFGPMFISSLTALGSMTAVIVTICKTIRGLYRESYSHGQDDFAAQAPLNRYCNLCINSNIGNYLKSLTRVRTPFFFVAIFVSVFTPVFQSAIASNGLKTEISASLSSWIDCIFTIFDGTPDSNELWVEVCGAHPKLRPKLYPFYIAASSQAILIALVFFPYPKIFTWVKQRSRWYWRRCVNRFSSCYSSWCSFFHNPCWAIVFPDSEISSTTGYTRDYEVRPAVDCPEAECWAQAQQGVSPAQAVAGLHPIELMQIPTSPKHKGAAAAWASSSSSDDRRDLSSGQRRGAGAPWAPRGHSNLRPFSSVYSAVSAAPLVSVESLVETLEEAKQEHRLPI